ncbi:MAG TPA: hypothetical protein QGG47_02875, partial [Acidobacteriota bacterium]|nr:hypothetical protein [Acidobacteriota bacterium]
MSYRARDAYDYSGDELWADAGRSTWRAKYLLEKLVGQGLTIAENVVARRWDAPPEGNVTLYCRSLNGS